MGVAKRPFSTLRSLVAQDPGARALIVRTRTANFPFHLLDLLEKSSRIDGGNPPPEFCNALLACVRAIASYERRTWSR